MKQKLLFVFAAGIAVSQCAQAQWSLTGNAGTDTLTKFIGTTDNVPFKIKTNGAERMIVLTNGRIGMGTINPQFNLDVTNSAGAVTMGVRSTTAGATVSMDRGLATANAAFAYKSLTATIWNTGLIGNDNYTVRNVAGASNVIVCTPANNVGIGTNAPTQRLDVNGNANIVGNLVATGTLTAAGGNSTNWNTAFGWGNHAVAGYLTAETDPQVGANTLNFAPKWDGAALSTSNIYSSGTFAGVNATAAIGAAQFVVGSTSTGFYGMYLNSTGAAGARKPFYGYSVGGSSSCWTYYDEATSSFKIYNGGDRVTVDAQGQVGIGTTAPGYYLDIQASSTYRALNAVSNFVGSVGQIVNIGRTSAPSSSNDILQITVPAGSPDDFQYIEADRGGTVTFAVNGNGATGIGGTALSNVGLHVQVGTDVSPTAGGYIVSGDPAGLSIGMDNNEIMARNNGVVSDLYLQNSGGDIVMCNASGQVSIGISTPATGYLLSVDGKIIAEEVRVELSGSWPDYVFQNNYKPLSIDELESYVTEYNHLPGVPSACDIETSGLHLGEMQSKMMEKIEEQALYIIDLNGKIKDLEKKMDLLINKK